MNVSSAHPIRPRPPLSQEFQNEKGATQTTPMSYDDVMGGILDHFSAWDRNGNGQLSWSEIRSSVGDHSVQGEEAVSLATLYSLVRHDADFRGLERIAPVDIEDIYDYSFEYYGDDDENGESRSVVEAYHEKYRGKLAKSSAELFPEGLPDGEHIRQGTAPSCGFLAATYAQAKNDPQTLKDSIQAMPDGSLHVKFPGLDKPVKTSMPTETERALFSTGEENGAWITALEKAWGVHQSGSNPDRAFEMSTYPEDAISAWTQDGAVTTRVPKTSTYKSGELPRFLRAPQAALAEGGNVVAWTRFDDISAEDYVFGHAYTVTGIDAESGTVSLRNPWGRKEPLNSEGLPRDGKDDGHFELSLSEFQGAFMNLARQVS